MSITYRKVQEVEKGILMYSELGKVEGITAKWSYAISKNRDHVAAEMKHIREGSRAILNNYENEGRAIIKDKFNGDGEAFNKSTENKQLQFKYREKLEENDKYYETESTINLHMCEIPDALLPYTGVVLLLNPMIIYKDEETNKPVETKKE